MLNSALTTTKYEHDVHGNKVTSTTSGDGSSYKKYTYNDKNQVVQIETEKGIIRYSYDGNGNVSKKVDAKIVISEDVNSGYYESPKDLSKVLDETIVKTAYWNYWSNTSGPSFTFITNPTCIISYGVPTTYNAVD